MRTGRDTLRMGIAPPSLAESAVALGWLAVLAMPGASIALTAPVGGRQGAGASRRAGLPFRDMGASPPCPERARRFFGRDMEIASPRLKW